MVVAYLQFSRHKQDFTATEEERCDLVDKLDKPGCMYKNSSIAYMYLNTGLPCHIKFYLSPLSHEIFFLPLKTISHKQKSVWSIVHRCTQPLYSHLYEFPVYIHKYI